MEASSPASTFARAGYRVDFGHRSGRCRPTISPPGHQLWMAVFFMMPSKNVRVYWVSMHQMRTSAPFKVAVNWRCVLASSERICLRRSQVS